MFFSTLYAQAASGNPLQQPSILQGLMPILIVFVIFYFLMIRPQKKKMDQEHAFLAKLSKGDEIFTKSGMIGTISGLTDHVVTLEVSDGVRVKVLRSQIGGLLSNLMAEAEKQNKKK